MEGAFSNDSPTLALLTDSLVDGVLQVLLQPSDLWVHTHLFVCLQLGTEQKGGGEKVSACNMLYLKMKRLMQSQSNQAS